MYYCTGISSVGKYWNKKGRDYFCPLLENAALLWLETWHTHTHMHSMVRKSASSLSRGGMPYTQFVSRIPTKTLHPFILLDSLQFENGAPLSACIAHRSLMNVVWALPTVIVKYHSNDTDRQDYYLTKWGKYKTIQRIVEMWKQALLSPLGRGHLSSNPVP